MRVLLCQGPSYVATYFVNSEEPCVRQVVGVRQLVPPELRRLGRAERGCRPRCPRGGGTSLGEIEKGGRKKGGINCQAPV